MLKWEKVGDLEQADSKYRYTLRFEDGVLDVYDLNSKIDSLKFGSIEDAKLYAELHDSYGQIV